MCGSGIDLLSEDQMCIVVLLIFVEGKYVSCLDCYIYIFIIEVLCGLCKEGFELFMVVQGNSCIEGCVEYIKYMICMCYVGQVKVKFEVNEIIFINSYDGVSFYQMLVGVFCFVCCNGLVVGDVVEDICILYKGNIQGEVIEGVFCVLDQFEVVSEYIEFMKVLLLVLVEEMVFVIVVLVLCYGEQVVELIGGYQFVFVIVCQFIEVCCLDDVGNSLWYILQCV